MSDHRPRGQDTRLALPHRTVHAYVSAPVADPPARAVVVIHELLGLNDDIRRITDRFAAEGYLAVAPDLFEGRGSAPLCVLRCVRDLAMGDGVALEDIEAARRWLVDERGVAPARIGIAGFCMGGGFTVLASGKGHFSVAAPFYGALPLSADATPRPCPTVASFGGRDMAFRRNAARLTKRLEAAGAPHDVKLYPDAGHSFMSHHPRWAALGQLPPLRTGYDEHAANDAWQRVLTFFDEHLA